MRLRHYISIFLAILAGVGFGVAVSTHLLQNGYLGSQYRAFVVESGSMEPAILTGSMVFTKSQDSYSVGDIITFSSGKQTITHRVAGEYHAEGKFMTKGDANEEADAALINQSDIIGKSVFTVPYVGYLSAFVRTPKGFVALIIIPSSIIIYEELKKILKEISRFVKKNRSDSNNQSARAKLPLLIPVTGVFLMFVAATGSFFSDVEDSRSNILSAGSDYGSQGQARTLVINEVVPQSSCFVGRTQAQWLEVFNGFDTEVNLKNFKLQDGEDNIIDLVSANNIIVPPQGLALLSHNNAIWVHCYDDNDVITANLGGRLNINTGVLRLLDTQETIIDRVEWSGVATDSSTMRVPNGRDTALNDNFNPDDFEVHETPTPGQ